MPSEVVLDDRDASATQSLSLSGRMHRISSGFSSVFNQITKSRHPVRFNHSCPFNYVVDDVLIHIAGHLTTQDLWALALVSRRCNPIVTPFLYSEIRLLVFPSEGSDNVDNRDSVLAAQRRVRATLAAHPHLNLHIRSLAWYLDIKETFTFFVQFVSTMKNIQQVHVARPYGSLTLLSHTNTPSILIPMCIHAILEGPTPLELTKSMLHPYQLEELTLGSNPDFAIPILNWISLTSFPQLKRLCLRFPGGPLLSGPMEIELLMVWRNVLSSLHGILEDVILGSRVTTRGRYAGQLVAQPSMQILATYVMPIFLQENSTQSFPSLRTLTLEGMGGGDFETSSRYIDDIRAVVPFVVVIIDSRPADYLWNDYFDRLFRAERRARPQYNRWDGGR